MKQTWQQMGMPVSLEIVDSTADKKQLQAVKDFFAHVDKRFSTYRTDSEISRINNGELQLRDASIEMKLILKLCEKTKAETNGYFDIRHNGQLDPSGLVKGWAIQQAATLLHRQDIKNFYLDVAGDTQVSGQNAQNEPWSVGIRNPFNRHEIIKVVRLDDVGIATSGTAIRGQHIYDPFDLNHELTEIVSLTVIGPNVYEADRFATAAFAMGAAGITFIESLPGFEAYAVGSDKVATMTSGFERFVV